LLATLLILVTAVATGDIVTSKQNPAPKADVVERPTSSPYTGSLDVFEKPGRAEALQIDRVMDLLGIKAGSSVADIGSGSGWFTVLASKRVGASGTVYGVDINQEYVDHLSRRARTEGLSNIRPVLGLVDDPMLPKSSIDAVLILKTYHEFSEPVSIMRRVRESMKRGGRVGIIDRNGTGDDHGVSADVVVEEVQRAGFALVGRHDFVRDEMDYFLVFERRD
jgi:predicted methyltransferase